MILVDTCGWIEYLVGSPLAEVFASSLETPAELLVPTLVQYELYKWAKRERDEAKALEAVSLTEDATIVPVDTEIALIGADLALEHGLAMADALILAVARKHGADLVTCDAHFAGISGVRYTRKG
jgi:predicted nucleic acid-binding protein